jgi:hypothetical protein
VWLNLKRRAQALAFAFTLLTALATMSTGEHYIYDLLLTVPFLWAVDSAASLVMRMK